MSVIPKAVLIDTNVWIDNYLGARCAQHSSRQLIDVCHNLGINLLFAAVSLKDVYYTLGAFLKAKRRESGNPVDEAASFAIEEAAWKCSLNMQEIATLVPVDTSDLWLARRFHDLHGDLEDDLILAAAQRSRADYLVTSDKKLLRRSPVAALAPEDMLVLLDSFAVNK